jgi:hypothetical protein
LVKIETILTNCIEEIRSGKSTLAECLDRYPSRRQELEPMLKIALNIREPQPLSLDSNYKRNSKELLLKQIRNIKQKKSRSFSGIFSFGLPPQFAWARVAVSVLIMAILLSSLVGGTAYAAQGSIPGDILYPVKITTENARLYVSGDDSDKVALSLEFSLTRLQEMNKLATRNNGKTELVLERYRDNLNAISRYLGRISDGLVFSDILESTLINIQNQVILCDNITDANPAFFAASSQASTMAINEQLSLLEILAKQNSLQATQINLNVMQSRLRRAQEKADKNQYESMKLALFQYQKFNSLGEGILESAQATNNNATEIENLSLQVLPDFLYIIENIAGQVPQEYLGSIETCRQMTTQFQKQAGYRYQHKGNFSQGYDTEPQENIDASVAEQESQMSSENRGGNDDKDNLPLNTETTISSARDESQLSQGGNGIDNANRDGRNLNGTNTTTESTIGNTELIGGDSGRVGAYNTSSSVSNETSSTAFSGSFADSIGSGEIGDRGTGVRSDTDSGGGYGIYSSTASEPNKDSSSGSGVNFGNDAPAIEGTPTTPGQVTGDGRSIESSNGTGSDVSSSNDNGNDSGSTSGISGSVQNKSNTQK